jgi:hypothetical protein
MLHPARLRIDLLVLALAAGNNTARTIEDDETRAGSALVQGGDVVRHGDAAILTAGAGRCRHCFDFYNSIAPGH